MTDYSQLMEDYTELEAASEQLFSDWKPAALSPVTVERVSKVCGQDELASALRDCVGAVGWLLFSDRRLVLNGQESAELGGRLLSGELRHNAANIRVTALGSDQWLWVQATLTESSAANATHLASSLMHQAAEPSMGKLKYRQLWLRDEMGRLRVEDAVFEGFLGAQS